MLIKKRGMSHIEVILSFVIFIGFLIFLLAVFRPLNSIGGGAYLDKLERNIKENTSIKVEFISLKLSEDASAKKCFCFDYDSENIIVKDENGNFVNSESKNKKLCIEDENMEKKFFYIYSCEEFEERSPALSGCDNLKESNYTFGLFRSYDMVSDSKLRGLHKEAIEDYSKVKAGLGLPDSKEFAFSLRKPEIPNEIILNATKIPARGVKVFARTLPIQIVYKDGSLKYTKLNIQLW